MSLKRTPLFATHQKLGARLIDFGGWEMPVQYSGIVDEHLCVRKAAGIFDISHMGEVEVTGASALEFLNELLTNDAAKLAIGQGQYTLMCNESGGTIDDLYLYRLAADRYLLIINASRIDEDLSWIRQQHGNRSSGKQATINDRSADLAAIALQGPNSDAVMAAVFTEASIGGAEFKTVTELAKNQIGKFATDGADAWIGRTGYTGEDGFEIITENETIELIWNKLLTTGHASCLQPCGLGARDTLRTEMGYPLYGHELTETISPIEAGVGFFVAFDKPSFIGREKLFAQKQHRTGRRTVAFTMSGKSPPPRPHYVVFQANSNDAAIGEVTSGTQSPSLNCGIGLALVNSQDLKPGASISIEIRGRRFAATTVKKPIYRKSIS